ncbi:carbon-nitrogen family hydrolase [Bacillus salitolerans]|uniref:Carbon-nitrogen family hydrolase n=1 Tax=Bacillus salitolerans TaxID=1437434 RepID=A0ABW4LLY9_9BACI
MELKISCIQFDIVFGDPNENYNIVAEKMTLALSDNPDVIVLPELWSTGYDLTRLDEISDKNGERALTFLTNFAKENKIILIGGSIAKQTSEGVYNTMLIIGRDGNLLGEYSKLHLFKLMDEHHHLQPGVKDGLFEIGNTLCAGLICYDIRFPEWVRKHTSQGAQIVFVVAEWPLPRLAHWRTLLISRAIENQCYVIACNRSGSDPRNVFAGHSMIIDPWGEIISEANETEFILTGTIDTEKVTSVRKQIPIFEDRRPEFYC